MKLRILCAQKMNIRLQFRSEPTQRTADGAWQTKSLKSTLIGNHQLFLFIYYMSAWRCLRCAGAQRRRYQPTSKQVWRCLALIICSWAKLNAPHQHIPRGASHGQKKNKQGKTHEKQLSPWEAPLGKCLGKPLINGGIALEFACFAN